MDFPPWRAPQYDPAALLTFASVPFVPSLSRSGVAEALGDVLVDDRPLLGGPHVQGDEDALADVLDEQGRVPVAQLLLGHLAGGCPDQVGPALLDKGKVALGVLTRSRAAR